MGIEKEKLSKIFKAYQTDSANQNWDGLGLGMTIVKGICASMNCYLLVNSEKDC